VKRTLNNIKQLTIKRQIPIKLEQEILLGLEGVQSLQSAQVKQKTQSIQRATTPLGIKTNKKVKINPDLTYIELSNNNFKLKKMAMNIKTEDNLNDLSKNNRINLNFNNLLDKSKKALERKNTFDRTKAFIKPVEKKVVSSIDLPGLLITDEYNFNSVKRNCIDSKGDLIKEKKINDISNDRRIRKPKSSNFKTSKVEDPNVLFNKLSANNTNVLKQEVKKFNKNDPNYRKIIRNKDKLSITHDTNKENDSIKDKEIKFNIDDNFNKSKNNEINNFTDNDNNPSNNTNNNISIFNRISTQQMLTEINESFGFTMPKIPMPKIKIKTLKELTDASHIHNPKDISFPNQSPIKNNVNNVKSVNKNNFLLDNSENKDLMGNSEESEDNSEENKVSKKILPIFHKMSPLKNNKVSKGSNTIGNLNNITKDTEINKATDINKDKNAHIKESKNTYKQIRNNSHTNMKTKIHNNSDFNNLTKDYAKQSINQSTKPKPFNKFIKFKKHVKHNKSEDDNISNSNSSEDLQKKVEQYKKNEVTVIHNNIKIIILFIR